MAIVVVTTSPTTLDAGTSEFVTVTNTGAVDVTVSRGSQSFVLRPTQSRVVYPEGASVTASVVSGSGQVSTAAQPAQVTQAQQVTANTVAIAGLPGTYAGRRTALYADFVTASDGVPSAADSGQAWIHTTNGVANTALTVASGMLTNTATAASTAAGYLTASLGSTCRRIGADFSFNGGSSLGGGVVLATWKTPLPEGSIGAVPDAAVHLVMNPAAWTLGYFSGGSLTQIGTGSYRGGNLATNGTKYTADVVIDTTNATATLRLPDGQVIKFANAAFTTYAGAYPCIEVFQTLASTDDKPRVHGFWADNGAPYQRGFAATPADVSEALYKNYAATAPVTVLSSSAGSSLTGSLTDVDSTNLVLPQIIVPPSGKIMVDLSMWVEITTVGRLIWQLNLGGSPIGTAFVLNNLWKGYARYRYVFSGLTPGASWGPYTWRHQLLDSGVGLVTVSGNNPAVMVATPVT